MDEVLFMLHMKFLRNSLTAVTLFLLSAALNAAETTAPKADKYKQTPEMATISRAAAYLIANSHFNQQQLNEKISSQLFDDYFKALDPTRMFFTAEDIKSFEPQKKQLGTQIRMGNVQFAFDVFKLFVKRLEEYEKFTAEYLKKKPDLTANEDFDVNRSKAPWAANRAELEQLWIKKTKNDLILLNLMELAKKEDAKKAAKPEKAVAGKDRTQKKDAKAAGESVAAKTTVKLPPPSTPEERTLKRVDQFVQFYKNMEAVDILEVYLSSLTRIYDPHSEYMSPRTEEDFNIGMKLSLVGIGALLTNEDGYTKIVKIIPGGPADVDGRLKAEDKIIAVAQENSDPVDILDMPVSKVVEHIRGKENTKVSLTVLDGSKGAGAVPTVITLKREKVRLKESEASGKVHEITQNGKKLRIGVITLPSFYIDFEAAWRGDRNYKSSTRDVVNLIKEFTAKAPLDGLVMDLRSNGGGSLLEAVTLTGLFIKDGPVVQVKDIKGKSVDEDNDGGKILYGGPLADEPFQRLRDGNLCRSDQGSSARNHSRRLQDSRQRDGSARDRAGKIHCVPRRQDSGRFHQADKREILPDQRRIDSVERCDAGYCLSFVFRYDGHRRGKTSPCNGMGYDSAIELQCVRSESPGADSRFEGAF